MNKSWRAWAAVLIVAAFAAVGCDSTQPDRIETRNAVLSFATTANVNLWECYETPSTACFEKVVGTNPPIPVRQDRPIPWTYSVKITIIRAGQVTEELATSITGVVGSSVEGPPIELIPNFVSLGNYDPSIAPAPDRTVNGVPYSNGKEVSTGSPVYLATVPVDPGVPNLLDVPAATPDDAPTFEFTLNSGDTVVVRARKQQAADGPQYSPPLTNVQLSGALTLSGVGVPVLGSSVSPLDDGAGFTFSFTVQ